MIKYITKLTLSGLMIVFLSFGQSEGVSVIRVAVYEAYPYMSESFPQGGVACRIVKEVFSEKGIDVLFKWYPLKRAIHAVEAGQADFSIGWLKNPKRERTFIFSEEPLIEVPFFWFFRKGEVVNWNTLEDFQRLSIGAKVGVLGYGSRFLEEEKLGRIRVDRVVSTRQNIMKLLSGRIDVFIDTREEVIANLKSGFKEKQVNMIEKDSRPYIAQQFYAIFNNEVSSYIVNSFNQGMHEIRETGKYSELIREVLLE